jgi:hypothetical protein
MPARLRTTSTPGRMPSSHFLAFAEAARMHTVLAPDGFELRPDCATAWDRAHGRILARLVWRRPGDRASAVLTLYIPTIVALGLP